MIQLINKTLADNMQQHVKWEQDSAQIYFAMGAWCADKGFLNTAKYYTKHGEEELSHFRRIIDFIEDKDVLAIIPEVTKPDISKWNTIGDLIDASMEHEKFVTDGYNATGTLALKNADHDVYGLALEFLKEQREEHVIFLNLYYKWKALDNCPGIAFFMDEYIGEIMEG